MFGLSKLVALAAACFALSAAAVSAADLDGIGVGRPLVIEQSLGGSVMGFRLKGLDLQGHHVHVIVDGLCASACTLLVDMDRANVCITTNAVFAYHQQSYTDDTGPHYLPLVYETPGLNDYIASRGGLPKVDVMLMNFDQAKAFYRPCPGAT